MARTHAPSRRYREAPGQKHASRANGWRDWVAAVSGIEKFAVFLL